MAQDVYVDATATLLEQERVLRYPTRFGAAEALALGNRVVALSADYDRGITVQVIREPDGMVLFAWSADDKAPRNFAFAAGKRAAALVAGHASPWAQLEARGNSEGLFDEAPDLCPAAGAFPIRVGEAWVATLSVSGLHDGLDHELAVRALEAELSVTAPRLTIQVS